MKHPNNRGFFLVEALTVMMILSVLIPPSVRAFKGLLSNYLSLNTRLVTQSEWSGIDSFIRRDLQFSPSMSTTPHSATYISNGKPVTLSVKNNRLHRKDRRSIYLSQHIKIYSLNVTVPNNATITFNLATSIGNKTITVHLPNKSQT